ncbi:MAG TPA: hypothetical protein VFF98_03525 [Novosphingobium sp.]|nr:hypothetical protein [Novosphingobium sp.]HZV11036.1 hypothetical protein [Novosphingobium sp.]
MMRVIVNPAVLPAEALAELKQWLGITTGQDDAPLAALLAAALDVCADFTGLMPLACGCEEMVPLPADWRHMPRADAWQQRRFPKEWPRHNPFALPAEGWLALDTRPVLAIAEMALVAADGSRTPLDPALWHERVDAEGAGFVRVDQPGRAMRAVVSFTAGLAPDWDHLPQPLRHGIIRLAAHQHRTRESDGAAPLPPASVAALWRPFRRVRLV